MASIIKSFDKRSGITYVYKSVSYWDKEKKIPRSHRKLIGKIDPESGEMVPTKGTQQHRSHDLDAIEKCKIHTDSTNDDNTTVLVAELQSLIQRDREFLNQVEKTTRKRRKELDIIEKNLIE